MSHKRRSNLPAAVVGASRGSSPIAANLKPAARRAARSRLTIMARRVKADGFKQVIEVLEPPASVRSQTKKANELILPPAVERALESLDLRKDRRLSVLQKLVGSSDSRAMWQDLGRAVSGTGDRWVYDVISVVERASDLPKKLPPYVLLSSAEAHDVAQKFRRRYTEIVRLHNKYGLNFRVLDAGGRTRDLSSILQEYADAVVRALEGPRLVAKRGKSHREVLFMLRLATYLKAMHGSRKTTLPLSRIVAAAANGVFETNYTSSDVTHILKRRRSPSPVTRPLELGSSA